MEHNLPLGSDHTALVVGNTKKYRFVHSADRPARSRAFGGSTRGVRGAKRERTCLGRRRCAEAHTVGDIRR